MSIEGTDVANAGVLAYAAYSDNAFTALQGTGWVPLDDELVPYDPNAILTSSDFTNGVFSNGIGQAIVAYNAADRTLAISFRGTELEDLLADLIGGLGSFQSYYERFTDLIAAAMA